MRILGASKKVKKFSAHEYRSSVRVRDEVGATCDPGQDLKTLDDRVIENGNTPNTGATNHRTSACSN